MDRELMKQINQAVDRGDDLVMDDLLAKAKQVKGFIDEMADRKTRIVELLYPAPFSSKEAALIAYLMHILSFCFIDIEEKEKIPHWIMAWYQKAQAWHFAVNLEIWDRPDES
jgi:hypothetical protein